MKVGVLLVGLRGATASTLVSSAYLPDSEELEKYLLTSNDKALNLSFPKLSDLVWGGWDITDEPWGNTLRRHDVLSKEQLSIVEAPLANVNQYVGVSLESDHPSVSGEVSITSRELDVLDKLRNDIRAFRASTNVDTIVMIDLSAPSILASDVMAISSAEDLVTKLKNRRISSSAPYYAAAAILEQAAVIDYTASQTLEIPGLLELAKNNNVPLAGRDGSTGQTLLKSVVAEMFALRHLTIRGWYSTNILGNHDGLVLQNAEYCVVKKRDKTDLLNPILGYQVDSHIVDINHYLPAGDEKEAWDAIDFEGWLGKRGKMRINWCCSDSILAAPALVDLIRLMTYSITQNYSGIQEQYGVFFKHALGTTERRFTQLHQSLRTFLNEESEK